MEKNKGSVAKLLYEEWNQTVRPFRKVQWVRKEENDVKVLFAKARRRDNGR